MYSILYDTVDIIIVRKSILGCFFFYTQKSNWFCCLCDALGSGSLRTWGCCLMLLGCRCRPSLKTLYLMTIWTRTRKTLTNACPVRLWLTPKQLLKNTPSIWAFSIATSRFWSCPASNFDGWDFELDGLLLCAIQTLCFFSSHVFFHSLHFVRNIVAASCRGRGCQVAQGRGQSSHFISQSGPKGIDRHKQSKWVFPWGWMGWVVVTAQETCMSMGKFSGLDRLGGDRGWGKPRTLWRTYVEEFDGTVSQETEQAMEK